MEWARGKCRTEAGEGGQGSVPIVGWGRQCGVSSSWSREPLKSFRKGRKQFNLYFLKFLWLLFGEWLWVGWATNKASRLGGRRWKPRPVCWGWKQQVPVRCAFVWEEEEEEGVQISRLLEYGATECMVSLLESKANVGEERDSDSCWTCSACHGLSTSPRAA